MSMWIISPGCSRSYRRGGSAGSRALSLLSPRRWSTRLTVAGETPTVVAILAGHALAAQAFDALDHLRRRRLAQQMGPRARILKPSQAFLLEAIAPFAAGARANACGFTGDLRRLPTDSHFGQPLSTVRRQAGILMDVHSALSQGTLTSRQHQLPRPEPDGQPIERSQLEQLRVRQPCAPAPAMTPRRRKRGEPRHRADRLIETGAFDYLFGGNE